MTAPGLPGQGVVVPEGAYVGTAGQSNSITDLNTLTEEGAKARMQGTVAPSFERQRASVWDNGGLLGHIADLLFGAGTRAPTVRLSDGMTDLNGRLDLMEDVSGYGGMIMSQNRRMTDGFKTIPFDTQYGPHTPNSVTVDTANNRFVLSKGTWSISVLIVLPPAGPFGGASWQRARITSYYPNGTEHMSQELDWRSGNFQHSFFAQVPLVIEDNSGYYVKVQYNAENVIWRILGGTDRTKFWVNRWDLNTDNNNIIINPDDGPDV